MMLRQSVALFAFIPVLAQAPLKPSDPAEGLEFFEKKIRPVLAESCYSCHSAQSKAVMGALLLDSRDGMRKGGSSGNSSVVPRRPDDSAILTALRYKGSIKMPPGKPLPDNVVADFEEWIRMGAPDPRTGKMAALPPP
ncbi:MAG: hypothetical protein H7Y20_16615, partial [Bryobacteraceae bacterium]|nr:hypothetical protein [Bryobacteraceae bacterium]